MKTLQLQLRVGDSLSTALAPLLDFDPDLVLCFGDPHFFRDPEMHATLSASAPPATLAGCSGAGAILNAQGHSGTPPATALKFEPARPAGAATARAHRAHSLEP